MSLSLGPFLSLPPPLPTALSGLGRIQSYDGSYSVGQPRLAADPHGTALALAKGSGAGCVSLCFSPTPTQENLPFKSSFGKGNDLLAEGGQ